MTSKGRMLRSRFIERSFREETVLWA